MNYVFVRYEGDTQQNLMVNTSTKHEISLTVNGETVNKDKLTKPKDGDCISCMIRTEHTKMEALIRHYKTNELEPRCMAMHAIFLSTRCHTKPTKMLSAFSRITLNNMGCLDCRSILCFCVSYNTKLNTI